MFLRIALLSLKKIILQIRQSIGLKMGEKYCIMFIFESITERNLI